MSDSKRLYFIPLIDDALGSDNPEVALMGAFKKIHDLGMTQEYKEGFAQFRIIHENNCRSLRGKLPRP